MKKKMHSTVRAAVQDCIKMTNSVSIVCPTVIEFGDMSIREAFRLWWHPYDMGDDFRALTGQDKVVPFKRGKRRGFKRVPSEHPVMGGDHIERRRLDPDYYRRIDRSMAKLDRESGKKRAASVSSRPSARPAPVKVLITLTYPLCETRSKVVTIDRRYPGEIFALTHDFYRELYAEDEKGGGRAGPMNGGKGPLLNRGVGPLVRFHDLGDLVFESCHYEAFNKVIAMEKVLGGRTRELNRLKKTGVEGEFTFGIGRWSEGESNPCP